MKAVVAVIFLVLAALPNHHLYYQVPASVLALLYSNSMFALLNSRMHHNANTDSDTEPQPQCERQITALQFHKSTRESGVSDMTSMTDSNQRVEIGRHFSLHHTR